MSPLHLVPPIFLLIQNRLPWSRKNAVTSIDHDQYLVTQFLLLHNSTMGLANRSSNCSSKLLHRIDKNIILAR